MEKNVQAQIIFIDVSVYFILFFPYSADDVQSIVSGKLALRYAGPNVDAMKSIAKASKNRSLSEFQQVSYSNIISGEKLCPNTSKWGTLRKKSKMKFSAHSNLHYLMNILTPKALSYHIPSKSYGWFKIMFAHAKYMLSSYGHTKLLICIYIFSQWQKQKITGLKPNFLSDID